MKINQVMIAAILLAASAGTAGAQEVVAVLASEHRAYRETYERFQAAFGKAVPIIPLGEKVPDSAKIVAAFGGKAAMRRYPAQVALIYAVVPGLLVGDTHRGPSIKIMMEPEADPLLGALTTLQPKLKRLAVLWSSESRAANMANLVERGAARGVAVTAERLEDPDALPDRLRELHGRVDAIWLSPDPLLINAKNFEMIKHFSYGNGVPFYVPTEGLAELGAPAGVSVTYAEMGRTMAGAVKILLRGEKPPAKVYSAKISVCVNRAAAAAAALSVPADVLKAVDKVFP